MNLFEDSQGSSIIADSPLADRMRPITLEELIGQEELLSPEAPLYAAIENDRIGSMIFWGPPGCGKTTIARIIANRTGMIFLSYSAVTSGIKELKDVIAMARKRKKHSGERTILFIDEIHRFNKSQQDAFLPSVETGDIILIGATTENPSFEVVAALLSRCRVYVLKKLSNDNIKALINRALEDEVKGLGKRSLIIDHETCDMIATIADGDARQAYNLLEFCADNGQASPDGVIIIDRILVEQASQRAILYDKGGEEHYNLISALHKSMRGSDPDASVYYLTRMLKGGEDPLYIARRLVRFAVEDVGLADPQAMQVAVAAKETYHFLGSPEGELALVEAAIYLATALKSNSVYAAYKETQKEIDDSGALPVPLFIRNAPTALMKGLGYGEGYQYDHDSKEHFIPQEYLPEKIQARKFYVPGNFGFEKEIQKRLDWWKMIKEKRRHNGI
ncbi:MAG: AAA family ATPase [candidate division Zixibacteria bacterium CG_4_9_14_3_um_filter_46_8]|nr:MAG: AAA family ATPase [candidate division Zixibacteria bacterium CG_4_9_14_3_um_filter_46_8]